MELNQLVLWYKRIMLLYQSNMNVDSEIDIIMCMDQHFVVVFLFLQIDNVLLIVLVHMAVKTVPYLFYLTFVIGVLIEPIVSSNMLAKRLNLYFYYSQFFVYAYFCVKMAKEKKGICNVQSLFVVVAYFMLFVAAILSNSNYCVPYKLVEL